MKMWFGESPYYEGQHWFIKAYDLNTKNMRDFKLDQINKNNERG